MASSLWICPFRAHKGKPVEDIPEGYLQWLTEQDWFCDKYKEGLKAIQIELAYRERHGSNVKEEDKNWNRR
jgi:uncharacterized protein (DUF3820 family)